MIEYAVTMVRPDSDKLVTRKLFPTAPINAVSVRQLAGYLTHTIFGDYERGKEGTLYVVRQIVGGIESLFIIERTAEGTYRRV